MDDTSVLDHYLAPLRPFLEPETVTEVVVNRPGEVGVEADGVWRWAEAPDLTEAWLRTLAVAADAYIRFIRSQYMPSASGSRMSAGISKL